MQGSGGFQIPFDSYASPPGIVALDGVFTHTDLKAGQPAVLCCTHTLIRERNLTLRPKYRCDAAPDGDAPFTAEKV